jgi:hypothetical protein
MTKPLTDPTFYHYLATWVHDYAAGGWTYEQLQADLKARGFDFDPHYHLADFVAYLTAAGYPPIVEAAA